MAKVLSNHNISAAWQHVKRNKGAAGIDNMSIEEFNDFAKLHWLGIKQQLVVFRNLCHFSIIKKTGVTHDSIFRLQQSIS